MRGIKSEQFLVPWEKELKKNKVAKVVLKLSFQNSYKEWPATSVIFTVVLTQGQGQRLLTRMWCSTLALSKVKNSESEKGWPSSRDVTRGWIQQGQRESQSHTVEATRRAAEKPQLNVQEQLRVSSKRRCHPQHQQGTRRNRKEMSGKWMCARSALIT